MWPKSSEIWCSPMYSVRSDRPLDALTQSIVRQIHDACEVLGLAHVLIGASARDIMLTHVFGRAIRRATRDVDVAVAVSDWQSFDGVMSWLLQRRGWSRSTTMWHRMLYRVADGIEVPLDIIPCGGVENPPATISWPPAGADVMNVAGLAEVLHAAILVQVADGLIVPVASVPGLAMLKLFAWADRRLEDAKDASDLLMLLQEYADTGNLERLYNDEMAGILESCGYDPSCAGACLLGMDAAAIASADTRSRMLALLGNAGLRSHLLHDMARSSTHLLPVEDDALTAIDSLLTQFVAGFSDKHRRRLRTRPRWSH